eukprot:GDKH01004288.1.p1 GENE.GDKH01004288.1~~GDKH01004288.1.p1  ORF type:complete len:426 (-),score=60.72 GDKH01004288.1:202-1479(-)
MLTSAPRFFSARATRAFAPVAVSSFVKRTKNPIRDLVEKIDARPNPNKQLISLSIGDPTVYGNFKVPAHALDALKSNFESGSFHGYSHSAGYPPVREAIARKFSPPNPEHALHADDVVVTSGCSQALDFAITALLDPKEDAILLPRPGFPLYATMCAAKDIPFAYYELDSTKQWQIDLNNLEKVIKENPKAKALLVNNPSNPTGSVFSKEHLKDIVAVAEDHNLTIVADEIYTGIVFEGQEFHSLSSVSENVPILECGGLAKQYMVPGWRVGWCMAHDRNGVLKDVTRGLQALSTISLSASSLVQSLIPTLLHETPAEYYQDTNMRLEEHARVVMDGLANVPGLRVIEPQGTMYCMVAVDCEKLGVSSDLEFAKLLLSEESVFVLPGQCFEVENFFRVVTTAPIGMLQEACERISSFCKRHHKGE